jgi:hypothetical protein
MHCHADPGAVLAGIDMDLGGATSVPVASFARIPHDAVPAIREAVRDPLLIVPASPVDVAALAARTADAWAEGSRALADCCGGAGAGRGQVGEGERGLISMSRVRSG